MEDSLYRRQMLAQDGSDWAVFAFADGCIQLDLGRAGLMLPEMAFRRFCDFVLMAERVPIHGTITSTTDPQRMISFCPRANIIALSIEQTMFRFRPHEFARLTQLCRRTIEVLGPAQHTDVLPANISQN